MSSTLNKLRSLIPGQSSSTSKQRHSVSLEPEVGFQIFIDLISSPSDCEENLCRALPELNVVLIAARHLPTVFGFKTVQGYNIKVKLFPGSKKFDSSIQTNSWPKFNESFKFPLAPDIKPSIKKYTKGKVISEFLPEEMFSGHFVVFTVYALLELPPVSFSRLNKTYRSLRERSSTLIQKVVDSNVKSKDDEDVEICKSEKSKSGGMPQLTTSETKRNIGSVTCYLDPKIFKRNIRTGQFCTDEFWLPIKDINTTASSSSNILTNSKKGVVEIILEVQETLMEQDDIPEPTIDSIKTNQKSLSVQTNSSKRQWAEVKRRIGITNPKPEKGIILKITTSRMRCPNKVKDELESLAGSIYIKTSIFEHNIYSDSWKSNLFYPSLSIKWDNLNSTIAIPIKQIEDLEHILIRTTYATKSKMGKKTVLGTVIIGPVVSGSGREHWEKLNGKRNQKIPMWHHFQ